MKTYNEFLNETMIDSSNAKYHSNIDKKWKDDKTITEDILTFLSVLYSSNGESAAIKSAQAIEKGVQSFKQEAKKN